METGQTFWIIHTSIQLFSWGRSVPSHSDSFLVCCSSSCPRGTCCRTCSARTCCGLMSSSLSQPPGLFPPFPLPTQALPRAWSIPGAGRGRWVHVDGNQDAPTCQRQQNCARAAPADEAADLKSAPQSYLLQASILFTTGFKKNNS